MFDTSSPRRRGSSLIVALLLGWIPVFTGMTFAQTYPSRPIRIVVPYPPGGFNDTLGRTLAAKFQEAWGQPVIVENKPGANTVIGSDHVAKSQPDGYTLLIVAFPFAVTPSLIKNMPYDTVKDFQPVILAATSPNLLAVNPQVPIQEQIADHIRSQMSKWSRVVRDAGVKAE